jgi:hypothetical protein
MVSPIDGMPGTKAMRRCGDPRSQNRVKNADDSPRLSSGPSGRCSRVKCIIGETSVGVSATTVVLTTRFYLGDCDTD